MRVLTVIDYYHPHWTGLTANAKLIAEGLVRRGHEVTVLTVRHEDALPERSVEQGVSVVRVAPAARVSRGFFAPGFVPAAVRLAAGHDVVHMHSPMLQALPVAAACRLRKPLVLTHQGDIVMPAGASNRMLERTGNAMLAAAARLSTAVSTFTRDYAERSVVLRGSLGKLSAIYPPIAMPEPEASAVSATRAAIGAEQVVGFAGRFVEEKGFDYLLRAAPAILERRPGVRFAFAGEREISYERFYDRCRPLVEQLGDRIRFIGLLRDRGELAAFYAACDVFALPSRTDCFASVLVEAMLSGTPVVAADIPGSRVAVQATGFGRLVRPRDPAALAAGILEALDQEEALRARAGDARREFDAERALDGWEALLMRAA